jgi:hypothetical protein
MTRHIQNTQTKNFIERMTERGSRKVRCPSSVNPPGPETRQRVEDGGGRSTPAAASGEQETLKQGLARRGCCRASGEEGRRWDCCSARGWTRAGRRGCCCARGAGYAVGAAAARSASPAPSVDDVEAGRPPMLRPQHGVPGERAIAPPQPVPGRDAAHLPMPLPAARGTRRCPRRGSCP